MPARVCVFTSVCVCVCVLTSVCVCMCARASLRACPNIVITYEASSVLRFWSYTSCETLFLSKYLCRPNLPPPPHTQIDTHTHTHTNIGQHTHTRTHTEAWVAVRGQGCARFPLLGRLSMTSTPAPLALAAGAIVLCRGPSGWGVRYL